MKNMDIAKNFAVMVGFVYCVLAGLSLHREERFALVFRNIDITRPLQFFPLMLHDAFAGLLYIWIGFFAENYIYGRIVTLWAAHLVVSMSLLLRFRGEDGQNFAWIGMPFCLLIGSYFYYLAIIEGVAIGDVFDLLEAILDG